MSEPDEPDEISRELDAIFAEFFGPPTEMDLRGVDPATFAPVPAGRAGPAAGAPGHHGAHRG